MWRSVFLSSALTRLNLISLRYISLCSQFVITKHWPQPFLSMDMFWTCLQLGYIFEFHSNPDLSRCSTSIDLSYLNPHSYTLIYPRITKHWFNLKLFQLKLSWAYRNADRCLTSVRVDRSLHQLKNQYLERKYLLRSNKHYNMTEWQEMISVLPYQRA